MLFEKTKINEKEAGDGQFLKKTDLRYAEINWFLQIIGLVLTN